jgi:hypothetical protein
MEYSAHVQSCRHQEHDPDIYFKISEGGAEVSVRRRKESDVECTCALPGRGKESCGTNAGAYPRSLQFELVSPELRCSCPAEALDSHTHLPSHADLIFQRGPRRRMHRELGPGSAGIMTSTADVLDVVMRNMFGRLVLECSRASSPNASARGALTYNRLGPACAITRNRFLSALDRRSSSTPLERGRSA